MNNQAKLAAALIMLSILALAAAYFFLLGLNTGVVGCLGRGCHGTASLAAQPGAYFLYMGIAGVSAVFMGSLAAFSLVQLLRGSRGRA